MRHAYAQPCDADGGEECDSCQRQGTSSKPDRFQSLLKFITIDFSVDGGALPQFFSSRCSVTPSSTCGRNGNIAHIGLLPFSRRLFLFNSFNKCITSSITLSSCTCYGWVNTFSEKRVKGEKPKNAYLVGITGRSLIQPQDGASVCLNRRCSSCFHLSHRLYVIQVIQQLI